VSRPARRRADAAGLAAPEAGVARGRPGAMPRLASSGEHRS